MIVFDQKTFVQKEHACQYKFANPAQIRYIVSYSIFEIRSDTSAVLRPCQKAWRFSGMSGSKFDRMSAFLPIGTPLSASLRGSKG